MAPKRSQEGLDQSEAERLREQRRAEREEARRQKRELAQIEREMRGSSPRWLLPVILGGVAFVAIVVFAGIKLWGKTVVEAARVPFERAYEKADRGLLQSYASADWNRIQDLKSQAEAGKGGSKAIALLYRNADRLLAEALASAAESKSKIESARSRFEGLYDAASKLELGVLLPSLWEKVEAARAQALAEGLSNDEMAKHFAEGTALLEEVQNDFPRIKVLRQKVTDLEAASASFTMEQLTKAFPEDAKAYTTGLAAARDAVQAREWRSAVRLYQRLVADASAIAAKVNKAKDAAETAMREFEAALADAKAKGAPRDAKTAWQELVTKQEALGKSLAECDYANAKSGAEEGVATVAQLLAQIQEARNTLTKRLREAKEAYRQADAEKTFLAANLGQDWEAATAHHRALEEALKSGADMVSQLEAADRLKESVDAIMARREELIAGLNKMRDKLAVLQKDPLSGLVLLNLPRVGTEIAEVSGDATAAVERGDVKAAVAAYTRWTELLGKGIAKVAAMKGTAVNTARSCAERQRTFRKGLDRFHSQNRGEIGRLLPIIGAMLKEEDYRGALPLLKQLSGLIPAERFTFDRPGVVVDNEHGLMWVSDGKAAGCLDGRQVSWHEAFRWVPTLDFAGFHDWRLPSEEELRLIGKIDDKERARAFPNTPVAIYWTGVPSTEPQQALAVDLSTAALVLSPTTKKYYVRAVRVPK